MIPIFSGVDIIQKKSRGSKLVQYLTESTYADGTKVKGILVKDEIKLTICYDLHNSDDKTIHCKSDYQPEDNIKLRYIPKISSLY